VIGFAGFQSGLASCCVRSAADVATTGQDAEARHQTLSTLIQHVSFEIKPGQLDACVEFYELLGFSRVTAPDQLASFVAWVERDGAQFHLLQLPETSHMNAGHAAVPLGDQYEATQERLRDAGHQVDDHEEYWGSPRSFVRDPAGNLVELMKFAPPPQL
jgi:catechol 2,3-dioxygenase-like lactoylglutathione lyase family enzyme